MGQLIKRQRWAIAFDLVFPRPLESNQDRVLDLCSLIIAQTARGTMNSLELDHDSAECLEPQPSLRISYSPVLMHVMSCFNPVIYRCSRSVYYLLLDEHLLYACMCLGCGSLCQELYLWPLISWLTSQLLGPRESLLTLARVAQFGGSRHSLKSCYSSCCMPLWFLFAFAS